MHSRQIHRPTELTLIQGGLSTPADEFMAIPYGIKLQAEGFAQASDVTLFDVLNAGLEWADQQELSRAQLKHWPQQVEDLLIKRTAIEARPNLAAFIMEQERICSPRSILGSVLGLYLESEVERRRVPLQRDGVIDLRAYRLARRGSR